MTSNLESQGPPTREGANVAKLAVICGTVIAVSVLCSWCVVSWAEHTRYYLASGKGGVVHKIDRVTGQTWTIDEQGKEVKHYTDTPLANKEVELIVGRFGYESDGFGKATPKFIGSIYNGTAHHISQLEIMLLNTKSVGKTNQALKTIEPWTRLFRISVVLPPLQTASVSINTIDGNLAEAHDCIISAAWGHEEVEPLYMERLKELLNSMQTSTPEIDKKGRQ